MDKSKLEKLPKILVIDDVFGSDMFTRNLFCITNELIDLDNLNDTPSGESNAIAFAKFCSGQIIESNRKKNSLDYVLQTIYEGWSNKDETKWSMILLDMVFKTGDKRELEPFNYFGLKILNMISENEELRKIPVIILSDQNRKPIEKQFGEKCVLDFCEKAKLNKSILQEKINTYGLIQDDILIGKSIGFLTLLRDARLAAKIGNNNILLLGEPGTGKELIAHYIHKHSNRRGNYTNILCSALPISLVASELFGYVKGAFTDAVKEKVGVIEAANKGTVFIDEFGDIPPETLSQLMRVLDPNIREIRKLGDTKPIKLDTLVVLATNKIDVLETVRQDLIGRVSFIKIPPLRERGQDVIDIAHALVEKITTFYGITFKEITTDAKELLLQYDWPGNVRELEATITFVCNKYRNIQVISKQMLLEKIQTKYTTTRKQFINEPINNVEYNNNHNNFNVKTNKLTDIISTLENFVFEDCEENLKGKLENIHNTYSLFVLRFLKYAFEETKNKNNNTYKKQAALNWSLNKKTPFQGATVEQKLKKIFVLSDLFKVKSDTENLTKEIREFINSDERLQEIAKKLGVI